MAEFSDNDIDYMNRALELARGGLGRCAPNPAVGCVIVKGGAIVSEGRTADGGRPHAERVALDMAGAEAVGADVYVTLEPCAHHGQTGPCADALVQARVKRVFVACCDPDERVDGRGVSILRDAGIEVIEGLLREEAEDVNRGFFLTQTAARPLVSLKMAVSADGKIAGAGRTRVQISGADASAHMHRELRARHDAIAVGMGTVIADNPMLTTRAEGLEHEGKRIVFGDAERMPESCHLAVQDDVVFLQGTDIAGDLKILVQGHGVTRLLVEGGAHLMRSFLLSGLWDDLYLYQSPLVIGADGVDAPEFGANVLIATESFGDDKLEVYKR